LSILELEKIELQIYEKYFTGNYFILFTQRLRGKQRWVEWVIQFIE